MGDMVIRKIDKLEACEMVRLLRESEEEGFRFVRRLVTDYESGQNRFDQTGEALYGVYEAEHLIAVCGLNQDPYAGDLRTGRLRRLYVSPEHRRSRIGKRLVERIISDAGTYYRRLTLRTDNPEAASFYITLGFHFAESEFHFTHYMDL